MVFLCEANPRVQSKLERLKILRWVQGECVFTTLSEALQKVLRGPHSVRAYERKKTQH
jgi:hypothetical protein